jgi:hypothetical protein
VPTPTDLTSYTAHIARAAEAVAAEPLPVAQPAAFTAAELTGREAQRDIMMRDVAPPAFTVTRRPALELTLPLSAAGDAARAMAPGSEDNGFDLSSPLDIPAFLRRQN